MNYLFFLIIPFVLIIPAYAEEGSNYIRQENPDGTNTIRLFTYDRLLIDGQWLNYNFYEDANTLSFESASASFKLDKTTCDFALYEKGIITKSPLIDNYKMEYLIDDVKILPTCIISPLLDNGNNITFQTELNGITRTFGLGANGVEWSSDTIDIVDGKDTKLNIIETCEGCIPDRIEGDKLFFGDYILDLKNEQHNSLKSIINDKGNIVIEYESIIKDGEQIIIDPIFTSSTSTEDGSILDSSGNNICGTGSSEYGGASLDVISYNTADPANDCTRTFFDFDITAIPDTQIITDVDFTYDITTIYNSGRNCDWVSMGTTRATDTAPNIFNAIGSGTVMVNNDPTCKTAGDNTSIDFGTIGNSQVQARLVGNFFTFGIKLDDESIGGAATIGHSAASEEAAGTPDPTLTIVYSDEPTDSVDDLIAVDVRSVAVDLSWSAPSGTIVGYMINYSTPWTNNPTTGISNTSNTATTRTIINLAGETQYSFRVGAWTTEFPTVNDTGNVVNVTTDFDPTGSFTPGTFNLTGTGTDVREIKYDRIDIDDTSLFLNVTADNDFELACNFHYKFANTNNTYTNIANVSVNADEDMASFRFNNVTNEIIDVLCWDQYTNASARYLITITDFPLLQQIADFKAGEFGTLGMFGALDFISLIVVIFAMVGFNRVNETVGIVLGLFIVGGLAVLSNGLIISWATTFTAGFAVVIMWAIATTRKD